MKNCGVLRGSILGPDGYSDFTKPMSDNVRAT